MNANLALRLKLLAAALGSRAAGQNMVWNSHRADRIYAILLGGAEQDYGSASPVGSWSNYGN